MTALDDIIAELAAIRERLLEVVDTVERLDLIERREELRAEARVVAPIDRREIEAQLERLVAAWDRLQRQRIDVVEQAGDLAAGNFGFTSDAAILNRKIDAAAGRDDLERRIRDLKARLAQWEGGEVGR